MKRKPRRLQVNRQQKHILLLALFLIKYEHGQSRPEKKQVLNYVGLHNLMAIRDEDMVTVSSGEEAWRNDLAWRREDLKNDGFLSMPSIGEWQITKEGESELIEWCTVIHHFMTAESEWESRLQRLEDVFEEKVIITKGTVEAAERAYEIAMSRFPERIPTLPENIRGRLRL